MSDRTNSLTSPQRVWIAQPLDTTIGGVPDVRYAQVVWGSPAAAELIETMRGLNYAVLGPYVLEERADEAFGAARIAADEAEENDDD